MTKYILIGLFLAGCATVRPQDVEAWKGVPLAEAETHPQYSAMQLTKRELSNGQMLYDFVNTGAASTDCYTNPYTKQTTCSTGTSSCHHQFFVKNNIIEEYRPIGDCMTNCSRRPASRPCTN